MKAAILFAKKYKWGPDKRIVVILADSAKNYLSSYLNDSWMIDGLYMKSEYFSE